MFQFDNSIIKLITENIHDVDIKIEFIGKISLLHYNILLLVVPFLNKSTPNYLYWFFFSIFNNKIRVTDSNWALPIFQKVMHFQIYIDLLSCKNVQEKFYISNATLFLVIARFARYIIRIQCIFSEFSCTFN